MINTKEKGMTVAFFLNLAIAIMEVIAMSMSIARNGLGFCTFYTEDSNFLALITSALFCIFFIINKKIPKWINPLRYITTCCLTVTFLVVIFVLVPMGMGTYQSMLFKNSMFVHHFLAPIISFVSLVFFENDRNLNMVDNLFALIPTFIYATIATVLNITHVIVGPYPFLRVYNQPVYMSCLWFAIILGSDFIIALGIRKLSNFIYKKSNK